MQPCVVAADVRMEDIAAVVLVRMEVSEKSVFTSKGMTEVAGSCR